MARKQQEMNIVKSLIKSIYEESPIKKTQKENKSDLKLSQYEQKIEKHATSV